MISMVAMVLMVVVVLVFFYGSDGNGGIVAVDGASWGPVLVSVEMSVFK